MEALFAITSPEVREMDHRDGSYLIDHLWSMSNPGLPTSIYQAWHPSGPPSDTIPLFTRDQIIRNVATDSIDLALRDFNQATNRLRDFVVQAGLTLPSNSSGDPHLDKLDILTSEFSGIIAAFLRKLTASLRTTRFNAPVLDAAAIRHQASTIANFIDKTVIPHLTQHILCDESMSPSRFGNMVTTRRLPHLESLQKLRSNPRSVLFDTFRILTILAGTAIGLSLGANYFSREKAKLKVN